MTLPSIKIEATSETWENKNRVPMQRCYAHGVEKYPTKISREYTGSPLPDGMYEPTRYKVSYGDLVVDLDSLQRVKA